VSTLVSSRRARARLFPRIASFVFRFLRFLFILGLVALPVPLATCLAIILTPLRRNLPAQVLRKEDEPRPSR
jgi:predicted tellurium resistance membrane protein TerC